jgi:hypothetical protein
MIITRFFLTIVLISFILLPLGASINSYEKSTLPKPNSYQIPVDNPNPPDSPVRLIFIHHSTGGYWLADDWGHLGIELANNNYFVSDTNYSWGPEDIGDRTDIGHWWSWFRSDSSQYYMDALYEESGQTDQFGSYTRLPDNPDPDGENQIILFKSCFPNSDVKGVQSDPIPPIENNLLRGLDFSSTYHTYANVKGIYIDLLNYFVLHPEKLFVLIVTPPLTSDTYTENARALSNWLVNDWLDNYPLYNVAVFDYFNVLSTNNNGDPDVNDLGLETGNHHRWWNNIIQHKTNGDDDGNPNILEYPTEDDHPSPAGDLKATGEFVTLLNVFYNRWQTEVPTSVTFKSLQAHVINLGLPIYLISGSLILLMVLSFIWIHAFKKNYEHP